MPERILSKRQAEAVRKLADSMAAKEEIPLGQLAGVNVWNTDGNEGPLVLIDKFPQEINSNAYTVKLLCGTEIGKKLERAGIIFSEPQRKK